MRSLLIVESPLGTLGLGVGDLLSVASQRSEPVVLHRGVAIEASELVRFIEAGMLRLVDPAEPAVATLRTRQGPYVRTPSSPISQWSMFPLTLIRGGVR